MIAEDVLNERRPSLSFIATKYLDLSWPWRARVVGVNKLDLGVNAYGGEDEPGHRIEKRLGELPIVALVNQT